MMQKNSAVRFPPNIWLMGRSSMPVRSLGALRIGVDHQLYPFVREQQPTHNEPVLEYQEARVSPSVATLLSLSDLKWLETFENYIWLHLADDLLCVSGLAKQFAMSESTLLRQLKRLTGLTPMQYLLKARLTKALSLLENRACDSVAQVASKVGYADARSFSRAFRVRFGKLPSAV